METTWTYREYAAVNCIADQAALDAAMGTMEPTSPLAYCEEDKALEFLALKTEAVVWFE